MACSVGDFEGNVLVARAKADVSLFSEEELGVMERVCSVLGGCSSRRLSELSHQEQGWIDNHQSHGLLPFEDAFSLRGV